MSEHTAMYDLFKDFAGPFAVVAAAIVAAWVTSTFSSKQTKIAQTQADIASGRLKIDLFDKRMSTYDAIKEVITEIVRHDVVTNESTNAYVRAIDKAEFLFGPEIKEYLDELYKTLLQHHATGATIESLPDSQRSKAIDAQARRFQKISDFYTEFPKLLNPYLAMRSPLEVAEAHC